MNTLCNARVPNHNHKSPLSHFILMTVREYSDDDGGTYIDEIRNVSDFLHSSYKAIDDPFYRIYGEKKIDDMKSNLVLLGEFYNIEQAKQFLYNISGEYPTVISY
jgi:hypothetical protein